MAETRYLLLTGLAATVVLTVSTGLAALVLGIAIGTARLGRHRLISGLASAYIEIFRNVPALVLIIFLAFALPNAFPAALRQTLFFDNAVVTWIAGWSGLTLPYYGFAAGLGISLNTSAYLAEIFRAGVRTLPRSILDAARTLGASRWSAYFQIILPEGLRAARPAISTRLIHNMKNTALASFVAVPEFFHATQAVINRTFEASQFLLAAAAMYLLLAWVISTLTERIGRRVPA